MKLVGLISEALLISGKKTISQFWKERWWNNLIPCRNDNHVIKLELVATTSRLWSRIGSSIPTKPELFLNKEGFQQDTVTVGPPSKFLRPFYSIESPDLILLTPFGWVLLLLEQSLVRALIFFPPSSSKGGASNITFAALTFVTSSEGVNQNAVHRGTSCRGENMGCEEA